MTSSQSRTSTLALTILLSALLACKMLKKNEEDTPAAASASASPAPVAEVPKQESPAPKPPEAPKLGDVKRFQDKEKPIEGVVKVLEADVKVFNEPDDKTPHVAELNKNIFVNRLATLDDFVLVEFPSGVGELSPGWVQAKFLSDSDAKVSDEKVKKQQATAKLVGDKKDATTAKTDDKKEETTVAKTDNKKEETTVAKTDAQKDATATSTDNKKEETTVAKTDAQKDATPTKTEETKKVSRKK